MPRLSSGLVIAGAYADKVRRTLFAQVRDLIRQDKEWARRAALAVAQLNRVLFALFVERLKVDKGDVVRVRIDYDVDEERRSFTWDWGTLQIEVFRRVPGEELEPAVKDIIAHAAELSTAAVAYTIEKLGETEDGDVIYLIRLGGVEAGAVEVTPVDQTLAILKKGAVLEPTPAIFERARMELKQGLEEDLQQVLSAVISSAKHVSVDEAKKVVDYIKSRVGAKPIEYTAPEEEELGEE
ncbi:MAG: DUF2258 domain-containing protein [Thermoprotei archaeon]|nr:MAG: DUF2258 domain-containing protein [Thermoprotei archaeon]RLF19638.1 MAG: DUF2258 domain-containing protein [Thermoprotei archaeon]